MAGKYLIAGLGNIGAEYAGTRHNIGFMVVDYLAEESGAVFRTDRLGSIAEISWRGSKLILLKPSTYMNLSGKAVNYWMQAENISLDHLLILCDDLALPFGTVRMRKKGSDGGHNGLAHINMTLGTSDYCRIRVGIGNGFPKGGQVDYVLGKIEGEEKEQLPHILKRAAQGIKDFTFMGADRAMNICNTDPKKSEPKASAPKASEPLQSSSQHYAPEHSESQHTSSQHYAPEHSESQHTDFQHAESQHTAPEHSESQHTDSQHIAPERSATQNPGPQESESKDPSTGVLSEEESDSSRSFIDKLLDFFKKRD
ncbi:MAG: aminoacyl-tRNA hydrolase [Bacteroidales bacterium]|nr:aminoacyl-tRNA hydrolase [Bacteroidales bacterium]